MVYTSAPEVIEASSASHDSEWRPRCKEYWLVSCCCKQCCPDCTLRKLYSNSSAVSHMHVENLVLLSVLRRPKSWATTSVASQASPLVTIPLRWWRISPALVPQSPATSPWLLNWTHRLARQWQQWLTLQGGSVKTPYWPTTPRWRCIKPVCSACCSMAVRHGLCAPTKNADTMLSTCATSEGFWASSGRTMSQARMSYLRQEYQACLPCLPIDACIGTSATYRMDESPRTYCMVSLPLAPDLQEGLFFASETSVNKTWRQETSIQLAEKL